MVSRGGDDFSGEFVEGVFVDELVSVLQDGAEYCGEDNDDPDVVVCPGKWGDKARGNTCDTYGEGGVVLWDKCCERDDKEGECCEDEEYPGEV